MDVAIIGAGLSGLSAALSLERYGVKPTVFEKEASVGYKFFNTEAMFSILNRPSKDCIEYIEKEVKVKLEPIDMIDKLTIFSKNSKGSIEGEIGYSNIRGRTEKSYEKQLESKLSAKILFNSTEDYAYICKNFEKVILATGDGEYASRLGNFKSDLTCTIKGAIANGAFSTNTAYVWFDYDLIPKGYGWIIPYSDKEANLVIAYPDYPNNIKLDLDYMWKSFCDVVQRTLNQSLRIDEAFEITRYMMGVSVRPKIDDTYFVGNCFGALLPGLGFGQFASILTGAYAAYDICNIGKYEELVKPLYETYNHSLVLRRYLESLDNEKLDAAIRSLDNKFLDGIIDKVCNTNTSLDILKILTPLMRVATLKNK
ncbi:NAD(P)/FAD-dependent oxidoreductase [Clostridium manihotivorum]|uniref:Dehydrogenase n=1 Tax=Clostridium manihotivorum TaxID=2320868 RepID=A0A410DWC4_9CLOT|nr:NAD(P)/FAD-dependent oxidoreductase [Clostridium manihotivorum]QAA33357.1 dehydrogenase [Clostridium manihotivorum]